MSPCCRGARVWPLSGSPLVLAVDRRAISCHRLARPRAAVCPSRQSRASSALALVAAAVAAAVGALSAGPHLLDIGGLAVAVLVGALIARVPTVVFSVCLLALCYAPEYLGSAAGVFAHPQLPKGLVYFAVLGMALRRGIRPRYLIVTGGYVLLALLSWL